MEPRPHPRTPPAGIVLRDATPEERALILRSRTPEPSAVPLSWHLTPEEVRFLCGSRPFRSHAFMALAEEVAARLPDQPDFSDEWIEGLVDDLCQYTD